MDSLQYNTEFGNGLPFTYTTQYGWQWETRLRTRVGLWWALWSGWRSLVEWKRALFAVVLKPRWGAITKRVEFAGSQPVCFRAGVCVCVGIQLHQRRFESSHQHCVCPQQTRASQLAVGRRAQRNRLFRIGANAGNRCKTDDFSGLQLELKELSSRRGLLQTQRSPQIPPVAPSHHERAPKTPGIRRLGERAEIAGQHLIEEPSAPFDGKRGLTTQGSETSLPRRFRRRRVWGFTLPSQRPLSAPN